MPALNPLAAQLAARTKAQQPQSSQPHSSARPPVSLVRMPMIQPEVIAPKEPVFYSDDIEAWDKSLRRAVDGHRSTLIEIAYFGARIRAANGWQKLGFSDEDDYRQNIGMGEKTWKDYLKLGERLKDIPLEDMAKLTHNAARLLTKVDSRIWPEYAWVQEAALLSGREFAMLVDQRNREANAAGLAEPKAHLSVDINLSQLSQVEKRIDVLRRQQGLRSTGQVVQYAIGAAERERTLTAKLMKIDSELGELSRLWRPDAPWSSELKESDDEREVRLKNGAPTGLGDAAILSQRITKRLLKSLREIYEVLPEAPKASPANSVKPDGGESL